ncbi:MAG: GAF domain-containing protein, partial [Bacteroidota bacterium]|nr:GAF domain-containing protein [Bacteroidota bacterium]
MKKIIKNYGIRTKLRLNLGIFSLFLVLIGIRLYYVFNKLEHINIGNVQELESKIRSITNFAKIELIIYMLAGLIVSVIFIRFISGYLVSSIKRINTALTNFNKGNIPPKIEIDNIDEFTPITRSINLLSENLKNVKEFAVEVGNSNYDTKINVFDNKGQLGESLASMRDSLAKIAIERKIQAQEEKNRNWAITGLAKFSDILRTHNNDLAELGDEIITNMVKYMDANQGAIFALEEDQENSKNSTLSMIACYAWNKRRNYLEKKINIGEDLAGQAVLDKETIYLTEIPDDYVEITSGLGKTNPKSILIVPLKINDIILGVIEIASLNKFEKHHIEFVEKVGEGIASSMSTVKINLRTVDLLKQSQYQTEQLRSQEEEMRQNIEELNATQEEVERKNLEIRTTLNAINQTICVAEINMQGEILNANDYLLDTLGYRSDEFIVMNHSNFIMRDEANSSRYRIMWEELANGKVKKVE